MTDATAGAATASGLVEGRSVLLATGTAILVLLAWEMAVDLFEVPEIVLPAPSAVFRVFLGPKAVLLAEHAVPTAAQIVIGFLLATAFGFVVAVSLVYSPVWREAIYPYLVASQVIPKIALAPLFTVLFGLGYISQIAFALFVSFFPVVISLATGLTSADRDVIRMCRALDASTTQVLFQVRLPYAMGYFFSGLKIASTMAVIGVVIGEFISSKAGLAYLILEGASRLEMDFVMAAILAIVLVGLALYGAVVLAEVVVRRRLGLPD